MLQPLPMAKRKLQQNLYAWLDNQYQHSKVYHDDFYQYKSIVVPMKHRKNIPKYQILTTTQWRERGIKFPSGWEQYMIYTRKPYILCLRRPIPNSDRKSVVSSPSLNNVCEVVPLTPMKEAKMSALSPLPKGSPMTDAILVRDIVEMRQSGMILEKLDESEREGDSEVQENPSKVSKYWLLQGLWTRIRWLSCKRKTVKTENSNTSSLQRLQNSTDTV
uniref:Cyclin-dependent kinases regulatory subunit n=1 Tax=Panagrellus redivivus TaxID=6233 RepID=A0A7E4V0B1_PANRE